MKLTDLLEDYQPEEDHFLSGEVPAHVYQFVNRLFKQFGKDVVSHSHSNMYSFTLGDGLGDDDYFLEEVESLEAAGLQHGRDFELSGSHGHDDDMTNDIINVSTHALENKVMRQFIWTNIGKLTAGPEDF